MPEIKLKCFNVSHVRVGRARRGLSNLQAELLKGLDRVERRVGVSLLVRKSNLNIVLRLPQVAGCGQGQFWLVRGESASWLGALWQLTWLFLGGLRLAHQARDAVGNVVDLVSCCNTLDKVSQVLAPSPLSPWNC